MIIFSVHLNFVDKQANMPHSHAKTLIISSIPAKNSENKFALPIDFYISLCYITHNNKFGNVMNKNSIVSFFLSPQNKKQVLY
ncbi:MAG: hypothetical protein V1773_03525, partial [bacterium]